MAHLEYKPRTSHTVMSFTAVWCVSFSLSLIRKLTVHFTNRSSTNYLCQSYSIQPPGEVAVTAVDSVMLAISLCLICLVIGLYSALLHIVRQQALKLASVGSRNNKKRHGTVIQISAIIVLSCCSRLPLHVVQCVTLAGWAVSPDAYGWILFGPVSLWPLVNPFLHTISHAIRNRH